MRWLQWLIAEIQFRRFLRSVPWEPVELKDQGPWYAWRDGTLRREQEPR